MILFQLRMSIPAIIVDLHKADSAFHQSTGCQAVSANAVGGRVSDSVLLLGLPGFGVEADDFGYGHLHAEGQLIALDARPHCGIIGIVDSGVTVELLQQLQLATAFHFADGWPRGSEGERAGGVGGHGDARVFGAEIAATVGSHAAAAVSRSAAHDHKFRQIAVE